MLKIAARKGATMRLVRGVLVAVLLLIPRTSLGQHGVFGAPPQARILVDVNVFNAATSVSKNRDFTSLFLKFKEVASTSATYPKPSQVNEFPLVDLGASFMLKRWVGIGVSYGRTRYEDVARLSATIPHPVFLRASATGTGVTPQLNRAEAATNIFLALAPYRTNRFQVRIFGGPSFFTYSADMVTDISYTQQYDPLAPQSIVTIDGITSANASARGIGFHAGGDFTYYFSKSFGVSAGVRFSDGTVTLDEEPMSKVGQDIRVGGGVAFVGLRFRFGG
jgi:hypothetical protein